MLEMELPAPAELYVRDYVARFVEPALDRALKEFEMIRAIGAADERGDPGLVPGYVPDFARRAPTGRRS